MIFLQALENFGLDKGYFEIKKISEFKDSKKEGISELQTKAIEFDKTKKKVFLKGNYKSCDALIFCKNKKEKIIFIEFKQITIKTKDDIEEFFKNNNLIQKAEHSREILSHICKNNSFKFKKKHNFFDETKKIFIFSPKLINDEPVKKFISFSRSNILKEKFDQIVKKSKHLFNKPLFIKVEEFDEKLAEMVS